MDIATAQASLSIGRKVIVSETRSSLFFFYSSFTLFLPFFIFFCLCLSVFFCSLCDFVCLSVSSLETFSFGLVPWMPQQTATIVPHRNNFKDLFKVNESIVLICGVKAEVTLILFNSRHSLSPNVLAGAGDLLFG